MRAAIAAAVCSLTLAASSTALAQALPDSVRGAGVTAAQWTAVQTAVRAEAARAGVSERALMAVAEAAGAQRAAGRGLDASSLAREIVSQLETKARQLRELESRLGELASRDDPVIANLISRARGAIEEGRIGDADGLLAQAEEGDLAAGRAASAQAETRLTRAAETMIERGWLAFLQGHFPESAGLFERAAETAPALAPQVRWDARMLQALVLREDGKLSDLRSRSGLSDDDGRVKLEEALNVIETQAMPLAPRAERPTDWAETQYALGDTLIALYGRRGRPAIEGALAAFEAGVAALTREGEPAGWSTGQLRVGNALLSLGGDAATRRRALEAFEAAAGGFDRGREPSEWAEAQHKWGNLLLQFGQDGEAAALARATQVFENAASALSREQDPRAWSTAQDDLGQVLTVLGERGDDAALERAIAVFDNALSATDPRENRLNWAGIQTERGVVLRLLGEHRDSGAMLADAVAAFQSALEMDNRAYDLEGWGYAKWNLALTRERLGDRAVAQGWGGRAHYEAALQELSDLQAAANQLWPEGIPEEITTEVRDIERKLAALGRARR